MEGLESVELLLIIISILLALYSIYLFFDQKKNLRIKGPKAKAVPLVAFIVSALGFLNYAFHEWQLKDLGACIILIMFSLIMVFSRNGIGESGIYVEGIRISWKQIERAYAKAEGELVTLYYVRKKAEKSLVLHHTTLEDVNQYLKRMRKLYHFGK